MTEIYAMSEGHPYWEAARSFAAACSWSAGPVLAQKMADRAFQEWERVFCAVENGKAAGFCTFVEKDELPPEQDFTPFIGFVFVGEPYRGEKNIAAADRPRIFLRTGTGIFKQYIS